MNRDQRVLVTGGSGYIAGFCIEALLERGYGVRASVRDLKRQESVRRSIGGAALDPQKLDFVVCDLAADAGWAQAVEGCAFALHVASPLPRVNPKSDDELIVPARDGALRVLKAARDAKVKRVVMTSSIAAIAYGRPDDVRPAAGPTLTEDDWTNEADLTDTSAYERSKTIAERAAWDFLAREGGGLELVAINPGAVLGPVRGQDFSASIEIVKKMLEGAMPGAPRLNFPIVDVRDVALLHVLAMEADNCAGHRFIAAVENLSMADIAQILRDGLGAKAAGKTPRFGLPDPLVRMAALFDPVLKERLFELGKVRRVTSAKAAGMLGWRPRPVRETILDCARSLIAQGMV